MAPRTQTEQEALNSIARTLLRIEDLFAEAFRGQLRSQRERDLDRQAELEGAWTPYLAHGLTKPLAARLVRAEVHPDQARGMTDADLRRRVHMLGSTGLENLRTALSEGMTEEEGAA